MPEPPDSLPPVPIAPLQPSSAATPATTLEDACDILSLAPPDRVAVQTCVRRLGTLDPLLGEECRVERLSLADAAESPLVRTPRTALPRQDERAFAVVETLRLPSGRIVQLRRRFAAAVEIDAHVACAVPLAGPALWLRELVVPPLPEDDPQALAALDAATVVEAASDAAPDR